MEVEIRPDATLEERRALLLALAETADRWRPPVWWEAGVREAVGEGEADGLDG
jgi:hypothetical protein